MKLWIDDVRQAPEGYVWLQSVNEAKDVIRLLEDPTSVPSYDPSQRNTRREPIIIDLVDIDHDAGAYAYDGGDYIKLLDWFEATGRNYPIRIHSMNPVGVANMRAIIRKNNWKEVF